MDKKFMEPQLMSPGTGVPCKVFSQTNDLEAKREVHSQENNLRAERATENYK